MNTEYWKQLKGEIPSYETDNCYFYSTNYGSIKINKSNNEITYACIGVSSDSTEQGDKHIDIKIIGKEVAIHTGNIFKANTELCTPNYPYKLLHYPRPDLVKVFDILYEFIPMSECIISVVLKVIKTFGDKLSITEKKHAKELINLIIFQNSSNVLRVPITNIL